MTKTDNELGAKVHKHLKDLGLETPVLWNSTADKLRVTRPLAIENAVKDIMHALCIDLEDDSLSETPRRVAEMYTEELFRGLNYENFPKCTTIENKMRYDEIILVKDIKVHSCCEHHLIPFIGVAHVGYIPKKKVMGLSKFNRVVDFFSRRPQVQERLTEQISATLRYILETEDVIVIVEAEHLCVKARGVQDVNSSTITSRVDGRFSGKPEARAEFLSLIRGSRG